MSLLIVALGDCMSQNTFNKENIQILNNCFWLAWKSDNHCMTAILFLDCSYNRPSKTGHGCDLKGFCLEIVADAISTPC